MNINYGYATIARIIKNYLPDFYIFLSEKRMCSCLTDFIVLNNPKNEIDPIILTSCSTSEPYEYYRWERVGGGYIPIPVEDLNFKLKDLRLLNKIK